MYGCFGTRWSRFCRRRFFLTLAALIATLMACIVLHISGEWEDGSGGKDCIVRRFRSGLCVLLCWYLRVSGTCMCGMNACVCVCV